MAPHLPLRLLALCCGIRGTLNSQTIFVFSWLSPFISAPLTPNAVLFNCYRVSLPQSSIASSESVSYGELSPWALYSLGAPSSHLWAPSSAASSEASPVSTKSKRIFPTSVDLFNWWKLWLTNAKSCSHCRHHCPIEIFPLSYETCNINLTLLM